MRKYKIGVYKTDYYDVIVQAHNLEEAIGKVDSLDDVIEMHSVDTDGYEFSNQVSCVYNEETEDWKEVS